MKRHIIWHALQRRKSETRHPKYVKNIKLNAKA
jgi:hypothetical protein